MYGNKFNRHIRVVRRLIIQFAPGVRSDRVKWSLTGGYKQWKYQNIRLKRGRGRLRREVPFVVIGEILVFWKSGRLREVVTNQVTWNL